MRTPILDRYATGRWLTQPFITFVSIAMILGSIAAMGFILITAKGNVDIYGRAIGADFSGVWPAGWLVLNGSGEQVYEAAPIHQVQREVLGTELFTPFSYPPILLLAATALATLPYGLALFVWQLIGIVAAARVVCGIVPGWRTLLVGAGFPGVLLCVTHGQTALLTAALLAGGLVLLPRREILAGVLFGLLAYKPQFGLLLPFVLAAGGYWRAIAAATVTVVLLVAATVGVWGVAIWQAFYGSLNFSRSVVLEEGATGFEKFQSIFAWVRLVGGSTEAAYVLQAIVSAVVLVSCVWVWRQNLSFPLKAAALLVGALLSTPYVFDYDLLILGMAIAFLAAHGLENGFMRWEATLLAVAWIVPLVVRGLTKLTYIPVGFLTVAAVFTLIVVRAAAEWRGEVRKAPVDAPRHVISA